MALRARKRQGGSSRGGGRPSVAANSQATLVQGPAPTKGVARPVGPSKGVDRPVGTVPTIGSPSAPYVRRPPPAPVAPTRGAGSEALRANATTNLGIAQGQNRDAVYRALMQLGDPTQFAAYQANPNFAGYQFTQDPNSVFASLGRQEQRGLEDIDRGSNVGNTFFSGMRLRDRQELSDETGRQRLAGSTSFLDDLKSYAASLGLSQSEYNRAMGDADQMDIDAALERDRVAREDYTAGPSAAPPPPPVVAPIAPTSAPRFGTQPNGTYVTDPSTQGMGRTKKAKKKKKK